MIDIEDIIEGESYACKFKCKTMLNSQGIPVYGVIGQQYTWGDYEGLGIIKTRDLINQTLRLVDVDTKKDFIVSFGDVWDVDNVELGDEEE
jgi:hypothetical protein